ncbi:hypothetical protein B0H12DRAFT_1149856 [Mycena haematopus]|nr:hypothetical protein B0H12DRAFT_1149856 [Mycena haematopus]
MDSDDAQDDVHGLTHTSTTSTMAPYPPVPAARIISGKDFADMHLRHSLAHAPDGVLFPFLHGLEGDNQAQNMFFNANANAREGRHARVPRFRGLVWVVAEEDAVATPEVRARREEELMEEEFDEEESEEEESEEEDEEEVGMDIDVRIVEADGTPPIVTLEQQQQDAQDGKHMHPVHHRLPSSVSTGTEEDMQLDSSLPTTTSTPTPTPSDSSTDSSSASSSACSTSVSPLPDHLDGNHTHQDGGANVPAQTEPERQTETETETTQEPQTETTETVEAWSHLLTCTFKPRELLRRVGGGGSRERPPLTRTPLLNGTPQQGPEQTVNANAKEDPQEKEDEWEFRPARVPDGISLRNFGIQVPIYATLSDIVLYSPRGLASPALQVLAKRFVGAVERKRRERETRGATGAEAPLEYNVFVLDADTRALREAVPELMMRVFPGGEGRRLHELHAHSHSIHNNTIPTPETTMEVDGAQDSGEAGIHPDEPPAFAAAHAAPADAPVAVPIHPDANAVTAPNTVDFGQRERDEMRELTRASEILSVFPFSAAAARSGAGYPPGVNEDARYPPNANISPDEDLAKTTTASHWRPAVGQVFLGNSGDVPLSGGDNDAEGDPFAYEGTNSPRDGMGYDVCVECHEMAPFPSLAHLRAAEEHLGMLEGIWDEREKTRLQSQAQEGGGGEGEGKRIRPPPHATAVIHLPFPSAPANTVQTMTSLLPVIAFLERCLRPVPPPNASSGSSAASGSTTPGSGARRWSTFPTAVSPAAFFPAPPPLPGVAPRTRSLTSPAPSPAPAPPPRSRPLKILIYSSDGYTESSPLALSLLMAVRRLSLPEAYLELQVAKRRSFFVYPGELGLLRRVEARIGGEGGAGRMGMGVGRRMSGSGMAALTGNMSLSSSLGSAGGRAVSAMAEAEAGAVEAQVPTSVPPTPYSGARPSAKSVSFAPGAMVGPQASALSQGSGAVTRSGRPRARTSPWLPSFGDHQSWFNDPRFDGSFPSRVLPFLYLGNLNHASNAYMLHALGITHVVSVGECALVPPPGHCTAPGDATCTSPACRANHSANAHFIQGKGPGNQGSLWIEEREGRIKVLDIKGVCDDGIDTLEPQLEPICEWIEKARQEGGQVLVHCRVGVSRSATVTIAYVMKHLSLPLVDAYLIVRSRRLSVLIQPNMRLLYNLCGWEIKLAKERAGGEEQRLRKELARTLTWPYLSKEVHALNEKYLH